MVGSAVRKTAVPLARAGEERPRPVARRRQMAAGRRAGDRLKKIAGPRHAGRALTITRLEPEMSPPAPVERSHPFRELIQYAIDVAMAIGCTIELCHFDRFIDRHRARNV